VSREVLSRLAASGRVEVVSYACFDDLVSEPTVRDLPFDVISGDQRYGRDTLLDVVATVRPDVLVQCGDLWMMDWMAADEYRHRLEGLAPDGGRVRLIAACMPDGMGVPRSWRGYLRMADRLAVCSKFGLTLLSTLVEPNRLRYVPFGVDASVFRQLPDREQLRQEAGVADRFVVGCVARNQFRKSLPLLVRSFAAFAADKDDATLFLHTDPDDEAGSDLVDLLYRYGLQEKAGITRGASVTCGASDAFLCRLYNLFDVFALPTMGEGFGLPLLEAMACGVPVVTTDCSAAGELVRGRGALIRVRERIAVGPQSIELAVADAGHLTEILGDLYAAPTLGEEYRHAGRSYAEQMSWDRCRDLWLSLLEEVVGDGATPTRPGGDIPPVGVVVWVPRHVSGVDLLSWQPPPELMPRGARNGLGAAHGSPCVVLIEGERDRSLLLRFTGERLRRADAAVLHLPIGALMDEALSAAVRMCRTRDVLVTSPDADTREAWRNEPTRYPSTRRLRFG
jgi:glycosyltransferase involved in cell wall biosynthesis